MAYHKLDLQHRAAAFGLPPSIETMSRMILVACGQWCGLSANIYLHHGWLHPEAPLKQYWSCQSVRVRLLRCRRRLMRSRRLSATTLFILSGLLLMVVVVAQFVSQGVAPAKTVFEFNDSHFHLTNYVQEGISIRDFLQIMGTTTGRSVLMGIPLQQEWSYRRTKVGA